MGKVIGICCGPGPPNCIVIGGWGNCIAIDIPGIGGAADFGCGATGAVETCWDTSLFISMGGCDSSTVDWLMPFVSFLAGCAGCLGPGGIGCVGTALNESWWACSDRITKPHIVKETTIESVKYYIRWWLSGDKWVMKHWSTKTFEEHTDIISGLAYTGSTRDVFGTK